MKEEYDFQLSKWCGTKESLYSMIKTLKGEPHEMKEQKMKGRRQEPSTLAFQMKKIILLVFTILTILNVEYVDVPQGAGNGWQQEIRITFETGSMQIPKYKLKQDFIPYGKVRMIIEENKGFLIGFGKTYKFKKIKEPK